MEALSQAVVMLAASCGIIAGIAISTLAKKEVLQGTKYLRALHEFLLACTAGAVISVLNVPAVLAVASACATLWAFHKMAQKHFMIPAAICGIALFLAARTESAALIASLVFISGLPAAHMLVGRNIRWKAALASAALTFLISIAGLLF